MQQAPPQGRMPSLSEWCRQGGFSRQSYYQWLKRQQLKSLQEEIIVELVREQKRLLPRSGGLKMLHLIRPDLQRMGIDIGRDRFFELLGDHDLLVKQRAKKRVVTTWSDHPFRVHPNLIQELDVQRVGQVMVADITYIRTLEGFLYLALLTDVFSRKIIGWDLSDSLELEGCLRALKKALRSLCGSHQRQPQQAIHHSDRGSQYCALAYTQMLKDHGIQISMAAKGNCYQNAMAERLNGILKDEFELGQTFVDKQQARSATKDGISRYNHIRPHWQLNLRTPNDVFESNIKELFV